MPNTISKLVSDELLEITSYKFWQSHQTLKVNSKRKESIFVDACKLNRILFFAPNKFAFFYSTRLCWEILLFSYAEKSILYGICNNKLNLERFFLFEIVRSLFVFNNEKFSSFGFHIKRKINRRKDETSYVLLLQKVSMVKRNVQWKLTFVNKWKCSILQREGERLFAIFVHTYKNWDVYV